jgi:DNA-binding MarR family transcriptional regulator
MRDEPAAAQRAVLRERLAPRAALLGTQISLDAAIEAEAVSKTSYDTTTLDLLTRLALSDGGCLRAVELCRQLLKSPSHISRRIDRAETAGLVLRQDDPDDRRANQVCLTSKGREVAEAFLVNLSRVIDRVVFEVLEPDEVTQLYDILGRIKHAARPN